MKVQRDVQGIPGLTYCPHYLSMEQHDQLVSTIDAQQWLDDLGRRVQHYGYRYDYKKREAKYLGKLPQWLSEIAEGLYRDQLMEKIPEQVIVNEYLPGQGIGRHQDASCFGNTIVSLSLGSACVMDFTGPGSGAKGIPILLEPCSAVVIQGKARHEWKHGIAPRNIDKYNEAQFERSRRVSVTFRTVLAD